MVQLAGKTALIIEDDARSVRVLEQLLARENMNAAVIQDTSNIKASLKQAAVPDVIFLDLEMPFTNGYAVMEAIQNDSRFADVPVIACTTHISHLNDTKKAGFDGFLGKPLDGRQFGNHISRILDGENVWEVPS